MKTWKRILWGLCGTFFPAAREAPNTLVWQAVDAVLWAALIAIIAGFAVFAVGCATIDPCVGARNGLQKDLETKLEARRFHEERCAAVLEARRACAASGFEQRCADDWTERARGEPGCLDLGPQFDTYVRRYPMRRTATGAEPDWGQARCDMGARQW